ncbi:NAD-dependent epimerase/dehydratase family protein [Achromobacter sp. F4_2707]|uniref:NAD-dependent epimerase/dehydratase family protein n=1 Tax=Achromobacter sp. F4_2707 TaxID=3114286 RepID=UPI0039C75E33
MAVNTLLLVGGDLCERTAKLLDPSHWRCIGLRRRKVEPGAGDIITWHQADLQSASSLAFLAEEEFTRVTHILYAPAPGSRTPEAYADVYADGLPRLLNALPMHTLAQLQRCVLVGSSAVWGPSEAWVDENTPVQNTGFRAAALLSAEAALASMLPPKIGVALRLSGLYGPGRSRLLQGLRQGTIQAPGGHGHWANRIHIDDAARACAHLLTLPDPQPVYIGTDSHPLPTAELYDGIARIIGASPPSRRSQPPSGKRLSNVRLRSSGWQPQWPSALEWYASTYSEPENH